MPKKSRPLILLTILMLGSLSAKTMNMLNGNDDDDDYYSAVPDLEAQVEPPTKNSCCKKLGIRHLGLAVGMASLGAFIYYAQKAINQGEFIEDEFVDAKERLTKLNSAIEFCKPLLVTMIKECQKCLPK